MNTAFTKMTEDLSLFTTALMFKFLTVGDHHVHTLKQDDLVERFIEVSSRQLYPKPDIAGYLKGNLEDNLLGIKLFRYYYKKQPTLPTVEMEFVHKNFLPTNKNLSYIITHIHTQCQL